MAISTNQRDAASGAASASPLGPVGPEAIRNILLAYISENLNPLSALGTGIVKVTAGVASVAVPGADYATPATSIVSRYLSIR